MTRPQIIRADTIDLQDQTAPSAQDHSRSPYHQPSLGHGPAAPHQASELRHAHNERVAEETALSHAWNNAHNLSEEPPSEDDDMYMNGHNLDGDTLLPQNGGMLINGDDHGMDEDGDDSMDDDGMDKMSSSPSISDGGYSHLLWPRRTSSLTPVPSPLGTPSREASGPFNSPVSSSPLSISRRNLRRVDSESLRRPQLSSPASISTRSAQSCNNVVEDNCSSSSLTSLPEHLAPSRCSGLFNSQDYHHHQWGEYKEPSFELSQSSTEIMDKNLENLENSQIPLDNKENEFQEEQDKTTPLCLQNIDMFNHAIPDNPTNTSTFEKSPSDIELEGYLLPMNDPLLLALYDRQTRDDASATQSSVYKANFSSIPDYSPVSSVGEAASLISDNSSDSSDWTTDSDGDDNSFDSFTFNDDDATSFQTSIHPNFFCSGWSGDCLQELEDIDFEFVYALHNFVATVEGQANAAKGDTMVLLDDSNSYWWLVRVVKDSTIGYLPAEHIETPTERLARLNKHRNIDACKMMYEDTLEKPKNPLRRAMRRRGQKQVTFSEPTYRDAPQYDYSSEEEEDGENGESVNGVHEDTASQNGVDRAQDEEDITTATVNARGTAAAQSHSQQDSIDDTENEAIGRTSDEYVERIGPGKSRNGTVRNTDSFFKDDTVETRKITLTPNLLRDDNTSSLRVIDGIKERPSGSFDLDKNERFKEDKKKEKKGVLGIFKRRKDKKTKFMENDSITSKTSTELLRESPISTSDKSSISQDSGLQRKTSKNGKLQKQPIPGQRNITSPNGTNPQAPEPLAIDKSTADSSPFESNTTSRAESPERPTPLEIVGVRSPTSDAGVRSPTGQTPNGILSKPGLHDVAAHSAHVSDATGRLSESPVHVTAADAEPPALVRDSSSSDSDDVRSFQDTPSPQMPNGVSLDTSHVNGVHSPVSPIAPQVGLGGGSTSVMSRIPPHPNRSPPPQPNGISSPLTVVPISSTHQDRQGSTSTTASAGGMSSAPSTPVWSDASLRQYLDESGTADIRDLLLLTRDTTGIVPVGSDHPLMAGLYVEERGKVKEMGATLDGLLGTWLEKKMRSKSAMGHRKPSKVV